MKLADDGAVVDAGALRLPLAPAPQDLRDLLLAVERLHRTLQQSIEELLSPHQLSVTQWLIVSGVAHGSGQTLTDFSLLLDRDAGSLSRSIHQLTTRGLLGHRRNPHDRRSNCLVLSAYGRQVHEDTVPEVRRLMQALDDQVTNAGPSQLSLVLVQLSIQVDACRRKNGVA